jgi:hypothetical protein
MVPLTDEDCRTCFGSWKGSSADGQKMSVKMPSPSDVLARSKTSGSVVSSIDIIGTDMILNPALPLLL